MHPSDISNTNTHLPTTITHTHTVLGAAQKELLDDEKREALLVVLHKARGECCSP